MTIYNTKPMAGTQTTLFSSPNSNKVLKEQLPEDTLVATVDLTYGYSFKCVNLICEHPISGNARYLANKTFFCPSCGVEQYAVDDPLTEVHHVNNSGYRTTHDLKKPTQYEQDRI